MDNIRCGGCGLYNSENCNTCDIFGFLSGIDEDNCSVSVNIFLDYVEDGYNLCLDKDDLALGRGILRSKIDEREKELLQIKIAAIDVLLKHYKL